MEMGHDNPVQGFDGRNLEECKWIAVPVAIVRGIEQLAALPIGPNQFERLPFLLP